jgi:hypothetical protein
MKKLFFCAAILIMAAGLWFTASARAGTGMQTAPAPAASKNAPPPGVGIANTLSTITGVAISPLFGVSAVGCYQYMKAQDDPEKIAKLPWFANPLFWVPGLLVVLACFIKDSAGIALPVTLKKPFDIAETIEHKISGLVATGAFVPIMVNFIREANSPGEPVNLSLAAMGFAAVDSHWLYSTLMIPAAMAVFFIVFLASNAINILILLSPFGVVDASLKAFRTTILASVVGTAWINPWMGAAWSLVIIFISWLIAGWSFRLSHFGLTFVWEFVTRAKNRFIPDAKENRVFLGRKTGKVPTRTYGTLFRNEKNELEFHYHPWLVLSRRTLVLPAGNYETGRGFFYSEILRVENNSARTAFLLSPRYRGHEERIAAIYDFAGTRDIGLRAAWTWFKSLFTGRTPVAATPAAA